MADAIYSGSLWVALIAGGAAVLGGLAHLPVSHPGWLPAALRTAGLRRMTLGATVASVGALLLSWVVHFAWGHGPSSSEALGVGAFFRIHPAYLGVVLLPAIARALVSWSDRGRARRGRNPARED